MPASSAACRLNDKFGRLPINSAFGTTPIVEPTSATLRRLAAIRQIASMDAAQKFLDCLHEVLGRHYRQHDFDLVRMASAMRISKRHLQRKTNELLGCGPAQYLRTYRLQMALDYLRANASVGEVARAVGFSSHSYFTSCFRAQFGATPSEFQTGCRREKATLSRLR